MSTSTSSEHIMNYLKVDLAVSFNNNWYNDKVNDVMIIKETKISHNLSLETNICIDIM